MVLALVIAAVAPAAARDYTGHLSDGGNVNLQVQLKRGQPVEVGGALPPDPFSFGDVPVRCDGGYKTKIDYALPELKVDAGGRFRWRNSDPDGFSVMATGRFVDDEKVKGRFHWGPSIALPRGGPPPAIFTDCDTGRVRWTAKR